MAYSNEEKAMASKFLGLRVSLPGRPTLSGSEDAAASAGCGVGAPAELPEGFELHHRINDGTAIPVSVLSHPNLVAIQGADGKWRRAPRVATVHGPAPYTREFFQKYLDDYSLDSPMYMGETATPTYLAARYPCPSAVPILTDETLDQNKLYSYELLEEEIPRLARRFPGVLILANDRRVLLSPKFPGYIFLHHAIDRSTTRVSKNSRDKDGSDPQDPGGVDWIADVTPAAYVEDAQLHHVTMADGNIYDRAAHSKDRRDRMISCRKQNARVDPVALCDRAVGKWEFLTDFDAYIAELLGYAEPKGVANAKTALFLTAGMRSLDEPVTVFWPDEQYTNPEAQPDESGTWEFLTRETREFAELQYGNQMNVTGESMWELRREFTEEDSELVDDPTAGIDLIFVPDNPNTNIVPPTKRRDGSVDSDTMKNQFKDIGYGIDETTDLSHDPYNYGENDQFATDPTKAVYQTRMFGRKKITVDRATVNKISKRNDPTNGQALKPELHKLWCYDGYKWVRWKEPVKMKWDDKNMIKGLDKWREQTNKRNGWPAKREGGRVTYTQEERQSIWDIITKAGGKKPEQRIESITDDFNKTFDEDRKVSAINTLYGKMQKQWKDNDGKMPELKGKPPRKKQKTSAAATEKPVLPVKTTQDAVEGDGEEMDDEEPVAPDKEPDEEMEDAPGEE